MFKVVFHFLTSGFGYIHAKSGVARSVAGNVVKKMIPHSNLEDYHPAILSRMFLDNPSIVLRLDEARKNTFTRLDFDSCSCPKELHCSHILAINLYYLLTKFQPLLERIIIIHILTSKQRPGCQSIRNDPHFTT